MDISGLGPVTNPVETKQRSGDVLDKESFLKLFIAQMEHQDPLNPMDGHELAAQTAQFSSLEQLYGLNSHMENLMAYETSQNNLQTLSLIGKEVEAGTDKIRLGEGKASSAWYNLDRDAVTCVASIRDEQGNVVRSINLGSKLAGRYSLDWDGRGRKGEALPDGAYSIEISAADGLRKPVGVATSITGPITGVSFDGGVTTLVMGDGIEIGVADVQRISMDDTESAGN